LHGLIFVGFVDMLNEMRFGRLTPGSIAEFRKLARPIYYDDGIEPTELFPRREDVDRSNSGRLNALNTDGWSYVAADGGAVTDPVQREKILSNFMVPQQIMLKIDAQVMLIKNVDETLVNGSMGKVVGFCHKQLYFTDAQGRWRRDGDLEDCDDEEDRAKRFRLREMLSSKAAHGVKPFPVVQFKVPGGGLRDMLVEPDQFKAELPNGEVQASRSQVRCLPRHNSDVSAVDSTSRASHRYVRQFALTRFSFLSSCLGPSRSTSRRVQVS
jgi:ATP-dependent DNA helicase PIF1